MIGVTQILLLCFIGTVVEVSVSSLSYCCVKQIRFPIIYLARVLLNSQSTNLLDQINTFDWYLLPGSHAKIYQIWLQFSQQPRVLYIAKVKPLNMKTSVTVRQIYLPLILFKQNLVNFFFGIFRFWGQFIRLLPFYIYLFKVLLNSCERKIWWWIVTNLFLVALTIHSTYTVFEFVL